MRNVCTQSRIRLRYMIRFHNEMTAVFCSGQNRRIRKMRQQLSGKYYQDTLYQQSRFINFLPLRHNYFKQPTNIAFVVFDFENVSSSRLLEIKRAWKWAATTGRIILHGVPCGPGLNPFWLTIYRKLLFQKQTARNTFRLCISLFHMPIDHFNNPFRYRRMRSIIQPI